MRFSNYKELFLLILTIWLVIIGGFWLIDIFIVPIDLSIPGSIGSTINDTLKVFISTVLVLIFLYLWDRLATFYYEHYRNRRVREMEKAK